MMCACDEVFACRFLSHQILEGAELETQKRVPVTAGFQAEICNLCNGNPEEAHPMAPTYGRTSKIYRYYWREIYFEATQRLAEWCDARGINYSVVTPLEHVDIAKQIEKDVIEEIKQRHERDPKYNYLEESRHELLTRNRVEIVDLHAKYIKQAGTGKKAAVLQDGKACSVEEYAGRHFEGLGYRILTLESIPFHTLFGVFFWMLIQDDTDPLLRMLGFGDRETFERQEQGEQIWTSLPEDFGVSGYAQRRSVAIDEYFNTMLLGDSEELLWKFDLWIEPSKQLRQYLWAHRPENVSRARELVSILPPEILRRILRYLIADYWKHFCGWPDLLVFREGECLFVEVKSSNDKLSEDQKRWIDGNSTGLHLPFKLVKVHKKHTVDLTEM